MKCLFILAILSLTPFISNAQSMQIAQIKFLSADQSGARAVTSGTLATLMYSQLLADVKTYPIDGVEKTIKHGKNYSCIKASSPAIEVQCSLYFPRITAIPYQDFVMNIRFDVDSEILTGYSQEPEIQQMLLWNLTSGSFVL